MKDLLMAAAIMAVVAVVWKGGERLRGASDLRNPAVITSPVYLEMRLNAENAGRTLEVVTLVQTVDEAECGKAHRKALKLLGVEMEKPEAPAMTLKSIECKAELSPRNAQLFDNEPTVLTYVSAARGDPLEREMRWIMWGTSVEDSEMVCSLVPQLQKNIRGKVSCIHALRSQELKW